ncbi:hypothetical protein BVY04_00500 [bacterium M21]|nr:hypothetical protein BVY04_00500 [bacterium M21]
MAMLIIKRRETPDWKRRGNFEYFIRRYVPPVPIYGTSKDGDLHIHSADLSFGVCTDLVGDTQEGSYQLAVRDATQFTAGDEILIHQTQCYRNDAVSNRGRWELNVIESVVTGLITLVKQLGFSFLSDADGAKASNTKTQIVRVPQYRKLTLDADIAAKRWDGYSGGILPFRTRTLVGTGAISAQGLGFHGRSVYNSGMYAEGWAGWDMGPAVNNGAYAGWV